MMLQYFKKLADKVRSITPDALIQRTRPLLCLILATASVMLTLIYSTDIVIVDDGQTTASVTVFGGDYLKATEKLALEDCEFEVDSVKHGLFTTNVKISYIVPLTLKVGNNSSTYSVRAGLLGDILDTLGITLGQHDIISHPLSGYIKEKTTVEITDVEYVTETRYETIPFQNKIEYSDKYSASTQQLVSTGKVGSKEVTCSVKYINGVAVSSTVLDEKITEYAVDHTTVIGTSTVGYASGNKPASQVESISTLTPPVDLIVDANGVPVKYTSQKTLRATAYTYTGYNCSTGVAPQPGYVAVDPREIPYGTKMYIMSADGRYHYGYAIAADTGGFIYGSRTDMDLFLETEEQCVNFGRRNIIVYFL